MQLLSVSQLNAYLDALFASDPILTDVWVEGEISNYSQSSRGHVYFTIKDAKAQMPCAVWKSNLGRVRAPLGNGQSVIAHGRVSLWQDTGKLQMYVDMVQPVGVGKLALELEQLRARLEDEGLFDPSRKRPLPRFPTAIGIVTSAQANVLQDVANVVRRRYPLVDLVLAHAAIQGAGAEREIAAGIKRLYDAGGVDVILVVRGGGSAEDRSAFNTETVARAIFASTVPVVTGIGHEGLHSADSEAAERYWTLADLAADVWAPTPSAAAELCTPDARELLQGLASAQALLDLRLREQLRGLRTGLVHRLDPVETSVPGGRRRALSRAAASHVESSRDELTHLVELHRSRLNGQDDRLRALDPLAVLARGYASVSRADGSPVKRAEEATVGEPLLIHFADGLATADVTKVEAT
ncbi:MAG: exodeoxyribonuclease VII large subunit [Chloroflexia bacterium]